MYSAIIQHRRDEWPDLSGLAHHTVSKCERIVQIFKETSDKERGLDSGMRNILRDMRAFLRFSEEKLETAKDAISTMNRKSLLSDMERELIINWGVAVDKVKKDVFQEDLEGGDKKDQELFDEIEEIFEDGDALEIYAAFNHLKDAAQNYESSLAEEINSIVSRFKFYS